MRELMDCIAATAAWLEFCTANRIVDTPTARKTHFGQMVIKGDSYTIARCLAMTLELAVLEQLRREQPRIVRLPVDGDLGKNLARLREGGE